MDRNSEANPQAWWGRSYCPLKRLLISLQVGFWFQRSHSTENSRGHLKEPKSWNHSSAWSEVNVFIVMLNSLVHGLWTCSVKEHNHQQSMLRKMPASTVGWHLYNTNVHEVPQKNHLMSMFGDTLPSNYPHAVLTMEDLSFYHHLPKLLMALWAPRVKPSCWERHLLWAHAVLGHSGCNEWLTMPMILTSYSGWY